MSISICPNFSLDCTGQSTVIGPTLEEGVTIIERTRRASKTRAAVRVMVWQHGWP